MDTPEIISFLWKLLDDIDTLDDACRDNDRSFRGLTRKLQKRRWETGITTDGYGLFMPDGTALPDQPLEHPVTSAHKGAQGNPGQ